jgi:hypothetical protein
MQEQIEALRRYLLSNRRELEEHITPLALDVVNNPVFLAQVAEKAAIAKGSQPHEIERLLKSNHELKKQVGILKTEVSELIRFATNQGFKDEKKEDNLKLEFTLHKLLLGYLLKTVIPINASNGEGVPVLVSKFYEYWITMQGEKPLEGDTVPVSENITFAKPLPTPKPVWKVWDWQIEDQGMLYFVQEEKKRYEYFKEHGKTLTQLSKYLGCHHSRLQRPQARIQDWIAFFYPDKEPHYKVKVGKDRIMYFPQSKLSVFMILSLSNNEMIGGNHYSLKPWEPRKLKSYFDGDIEIIKTNITVIKLPLVC